MSNNLTNCLREALAKAKPILDELGLPVYSAHINQLANSLVLSGCEDDDAWVIVRILYKEASDLANHELKEWLENPKRRKVLELLYKPSQS
jgi:hypothetical protein